LIENVKIFQVNFNFLDFNTICKFNLMKNDRFFNSIYSLNHASLINSLQRKRKGF